MSKKYHIDINGLPVLCHAQIRQCPRGNSQNHYSSLEEAQIYADFLNEIDCELNLTKHMKENTLLGFQDIKERGQKIENIMRNPLIYRFNTKNFYFDEINELWDEQRSELHDEIINDILNKYKNVSNDKKFILSAGLPGAGKTTVLSNIKEIDLQNYAIINSDDIKEAMIEKNMIPEIRGLTPLECANLIHEESAYISDMLQLKLCEQGKNIIYDMTSKTLKSVNNRISVFKNQGYRIEDATMIFVDIKIETSKNRAYNRYMEGINNYIIGKSTQGGRYIPEEIFNKCKPTWENTNSINQEVFKSIQMNKNIPIKTIEYNNDGTKPKKIN